MIIAVLTLIFLAIFLFYHRASIFVWLIVLCLVDGFYAVSSGVWNTYFLSVSIIILLLLIFCIRNLRERVLLKPFLGTLRRFMPAMSQTEREAIHAGTVTFEGELFSGNPNWQRFMNARAPHLTHEEQAFIDGPVEELCLRLSDWEITHYQLDLPDDLWDFLKKQGFFGLIIPKEYGGKGFSAYAHSRVITKIAGLSVTASTTVSVPNSLGPAELLLHYGTDSQRQHYLPRLARGEEIPCFALTSPDAGSDAGAMMDRGIVCKRMQNGQEVLGILLNWNKRYITLAPVATVIGLAFKVYDPLHLLDHTVSLGITCALIPRDTPGITIGNRHFPLNCPFQNGPIQGKDVFITLDQVIGGPEYIGQGWRMLMECLAAGRAITLPSSAIGGAKVALFASGAYARVREQFGTSLSHFEGIQEPLTRMAVRLYLMNASANLAIASIDQGAKPAIASAIVKYHVTEMGRHVAIDAMDIHGGKGICLGPSNYLARGYQTAPIAITVEGANILTRNLIIFGQGAIRCHPHILHIMEACALSSDCIALRNLDSHIFKYGSFIVSNVCRTFFMGLTDARLVQTTKSPLKRYLQYATRFSCALALLSDCAMLVYGAQLKRKESVSSRLGDILSYLYMLSAVVKKYQDDGLHQDDYQLAKAACDHCLQEIQTRFVVILRNFKSGFLGHLLRILIFPLGRRFYASKDQLLSDVVQSVVSSTGTRDRLVKGICVKKPILQDLQEALDETIAVEAIHKKLQKFYAKTDDLCHDWPHVASLALQQNLITPEEHQSWLFAYEAKQKVIRVDDFTNSELFHKQA